MYMPKSQPYSSNNTIISYKEMILHFHNKTDIELSYGASDLSYFVIYFDLVPIISWAAPNHIYILNTCFLCETLQEHSQYF